MPSLLLKEAALSNGVGGGAVTAPFPAPAPAPPWASSTPCAPGLGVIYCRCQVLGDMWKAWLGSCVGEVEVGRTIKADTPLAHAPLPMCVTLSLFLSTA